MQDPMERDMIIQRRAHALEQNLECRASRTIAPARPYTRAKGAREGERKEEQLFREDFLSGVRLYISLFSLLELLRRDAAEEEF